MGQPNVWTWLAGIIGMVLSGWVVARVSKPGTRENAIIDQLQQDLGAERSEREKMSARLDSQQGQIENLATQVSRLLHRDLLWDFHATRVEGQVEQLGGTPYARPLGLHPIDEGALG